MWYIIIDNMDDVRCVHKDIIQVYTLLSAVLARQGPYVFIGGVTTLTLLKAKVTQVIGWLAYQVVGSAGISSMSLLCGNDTMFLCFSYVVDAESF